MTRIFPAFILMATALWHGTELRGQGDDSGHPPSRWSENLSEIRDVIPTRIEEPSCLVDENGLPRRLIVTSNGTALFEEPKHGSKRIHDLAIHDRLYVFVLDSGNGYIGASLTPFGDSGVGWVPSVYCLPWDHNVAIFLSGRSVPEGVGRLDVWATREDAETGDARRAMYVLPIDREPNGPDQFYPILDKSETGTLYKIGVLHGGDQKWRDEYGERLPAAFLQELFDNLHVVNIVFLVDTNPAMKPYVEKLVDGIPGIFTKLKNVSEATLEGEEALQLKLNIGCVAYQNAFEHYDIKEVSPLSNDRQQLITGLATLRREHSPSGISALLSCLDKQPFVRGALNRIVWATNVAPTENQEELLAQVGAKARGRYVQIDVFLCDGDEPAKSAYAALAERSGGKVFSIVEPDGLLPTILHQIQDRLAFITMEKLFSESSMLAEQEYRAALMLQKLLDLTPTEDADKSVENYRKAIRLRKFLAARGLDVHGWDLRTAWVKVTPNDSVTMRPYIAVPRWQLSRAIAGMLGTLEEAGRGKNLAENAHVFLASLLKLQAGTDAVAGISRGETSPTTRAISLPIVSDALRRGEAGVPRFARAYRDKALGLIDHWRNRANQEGEYVFVPVDMLP